MRTDERRKSGRGAAWAIAALVALATLPGCSGGGSDSSGGTTTVVMGDSSFIARITDGFGFAVDGVVALAEDGGRERLFGADATPRTFDLSFFGDEFRPKVLAAGPIGSGTYTGLEVCYRSPLVESDGSTYPASPATGCFTITFPTPIEVTDGSGHAIRVDFDLALSVESDGASNYSFTPRVNGYGFSTDEASAVDAFRARVRHWSDDHDWASCTLLQPNGAGGWTEAGDLTVRFLPESIFVFVDGTPVRFDNFFPTSALDSYVGRDFHFTGRVHDDGSFTAESAELDFTEVGAFDNVAIEGIVTEHDGDDLVVMLTRVLDDDGNVIPAGTEVVHATFGSDEAPVYIRSTGESASRDMLIPGTMTWFTGHFAARPLRSGTPGGIEGEDDSSYDSAVLDRPSRPDFVVSCARLADQQVSGVVRRFDAHSSVVLAELTGLQGFDLGDETPPRFAFRVFDDTPITVDGIVSIEIDGLHDDDEFELMAVPIVGAYGGRQTASLKDEDDVTPTLPGGHHSPVFYGRELRVRGREFSGEVVTGIDGAGYAFDLTGDGSDFGLPDPSTFRIVVPYYVFAQSENESGLETGIGRDGFFSRLPFALTVECRGWYDPSSSTPTIVATWLEVETP